VKEITRRSVPDWTASFLWQGYRFLPGLWRRYGTGGREIRLLGERAVCLVGAEAAELLYDQRRFTRAGTLPGAVRRTLVRDGGVQGWTAPHTGTGRRCSCTCWLPGPSKRWPDRRRHTGDRVSGPAA
jgi:hypothetical protein